MTQRNSQSKSSHELGLPYPQQKKFRLFPHLHDFWAQVKTACLMGCAFPYVFLSKRLFTEGDGYFRMSLTRKQPVQAEK